VAAAARWLGVAPATLRTWDRRYGLGPSAHSPGRHRHYSHDDLARLDAMRRALLRGATAAEAARIALNGAPDTDPRPRETTGPRPPREPVPDRTSETVIGVPRGAGGGVLRLGTAGPGARGLGRAAMALDSTAVRDLVAGEVDATGVVRAWDEVVRPVLVAVAHRWAYSGAGVEIEHLLSDCVTAVLSARAMPHSPSGSPPVLLAGMPGDQHVLPTLALAAALAEQGVGCRPLGGDLPSPALAAAIRRIAPGAVFLWSQLARTADVDALGSLPRTRPRFRTYVGGPGWAGRELPPRVVLLESLGSACSEICAAVSV
jgi:hypothetical protein